MISLIENIWFQWLWARYRNIEYLCHWTSWWPSLSDFRTSVFRCTACWMRSGIWGHLRSWSLELTSSPRCCRRCPLRHFQRPRSALMANSMESTFETHTWRRSDYALRLCLVHGFSEGKEKKTMRKMLFLVRLTRKMVRKFWREKNLLKNKCKKFEFFYSLPFYFSWVPIFFQKFVLSNVILAWRKY